MNDRHHLLLVHPFVANVCGPDQSLFGLVQQLPREAYTIRMIVPMMNEVVAKYSPYVQAIDVNPNAGYYHHFRYVRSNLWLAFNNLTSYGGIRSYLQENSIDLVHTNIESAWVYGLAARSLKIPSIVHLRGLTTVGTRMGARLMPEILKLCADQLLAVSHQVAEAFERAGIFRHKLSVVENGVDITRFRPRNRHSNPGRLDGHAVIGAVGSADPRKGWLNLVIACAHLRLKYPNLRCIFVGEMGAGEVVYQAGCTYREELLRLVKEHGLQEIVEFVGMKSDMPEVYTGLDLLVQPSETEAGPRAPIEAMACGIPVVATRVGGNNDYVQDGVCGKLCPPGDPQALAQAIDSLLSNQALRGRMGSEGRRIAMERFSLESHAQRVQAVYRILLQAQGSMQSSGGE